MMQEFITVCPRNCYSTCTFRVFTEDGRVKRILPWEGNRATPEGPCIKGLSYLEREYSKDRLLYPLKRNPDNSFDKISMDEALEIISDKLLEARRTHGPHSVLFYRGSGYAGLSNDISVDFWNNYGGATTTYGNLCWPAGLEAIRLTLGDIKHNAPWDLANAQLIIMWGKNPAETNVQEMIHVDRALKNGAKLVVIDPRRTPTADKADLLVRPVPGTDAALALAVAKVIIDKGLYDKNFIEQHVKGFEEFASSLKRSPEETERITGIPASTVDELAALTGKTDRVTITAGYGLQRYTNGGQTIRSVLAIPVITGKIGRRGCGFNFANLQGYIYDTVKEPLSYYPDAERDRPFRRVISMARFADDYFSISDPPVTVAWIERGNPLIQLPDSNGVRKAFGSIPFKVVVEQFMTDTAMLADIILPAKGIFEQPDIVSSYWHPYVQFKPCIADLPGEVIPESEIYRRLAAKMNIRCDNMPGQGNNEMEQWLSHRISGSNESDIEKLRREPLIPVQAEEIAWRDLEFGTPSGKIELWSEDARKRWGVHQLPDYVPLDEDKDTKHPFRLISPNIGSRIHSQFGNLKVIKEVTEEPAWEIAPADAEVLGIESGDEIRVFNNLGEITGKARVSHRVRKGTVIFPNGIWISEGGGVNALIRSRETDMGHGAAFHNTRVAIEKVAL